MDHAEYTSGYDWARKCWIVGLRNNDGTISPNAPATELCANADEARARAEALNKEREG